MHFWIPALAIRFSSDCRVEKLPGKFCCRFDIPQLPWKARPLAELRELARLGDAPGLRQAEGFTQKDMPSGRFSAQASLVCFVKQIFRKSSSNSFGSQHERSSDFTKGCGTYPSFLFPSMSESVTRRLSPLNSTSLPWWTILSTSADASLSSANTVPHFPNSMLVVSTIDWRS